MKTAPTLDIDAILDDRGTRIIVCCGAGGVGKTTTAAALGLRAAERGRSVVVLTVDPAQRLAQAMGLTELDNTPRLVLGDTAGAASSYAMMLDMKRTFDEIVEAHADAGAGAPDPDQPLLPVAFSSSPARRSTWPWRSSASSAAGDWDLIVVDTPPSRSALDFLDAPERLGRFLDGRLIRILTAPAKAGGRSAFSSSTAG